MSCIPVQSLCVVFEASGAPSLGYTNPVVAMAVVVGILGYVAVSSQLQEILAVADAEYLDFFEDLWTGCLLVSYMEKTLGIWNGCHREDLVEALGRAAIARSVESAGTSILFSSQHQHYRHFRNSLNIFLQNVCFGASFSSPTRAHTHTHHMLGQDNLRPRPTTIVYQYHYSLRGLNISNVGVS